MHTCSGCWLRASGLALRWTREEDIPGSRPCNEEPGAGREQSRLETGAAGLTDQGVLAVGKMPAEPREARGKGREQERNRASVG